MHRIKLIRFVALAMALSLILATQVPPLLKHINQRTRNILGRRYGAFKKGFTGQAPIIRRRTT